MSTVITHLPAGFLRWKRLRDQPVLSGLPYQVLTLLLDASESEGHDGWRRGWTQTSIAARLGVTMHAIRKAFKTLRRWCYWKPCKRVLGRGRVLHWWCVTDEPGQFGDADARIQAEFHAASQGAKPEFRSDVDHQQLISDTEPRSTTTDGGTTPQPPAGDNSRTDRRRRRTTLASLMRRLKSRARLEPTELPDQLRPWAMRATKLAHDLRIHPPQRPEAATYLACLLCAGHGEEELLVEFSQNMAGARDVGRVTLSRIRKRADAFLAVHG